MTRGTDRDQPAQGTTASRAEDLRRARIEAAASGGVRVGAVSLEALYLMPTEFTDAYQRLFHEALKESGTQGRAGDPNPTVRGRPRLTRGEGKGDVPKGQPLDRDPDRGGGSARAGGKRHRDHWTVKSEESFRLKGWVDRRLRELAEEITGRTRLRNAAKVDAPLQCPGPNCRRIVKAEWGWCPHCGQHQNTARPARNREQEG